MAHREYAWNWRGLIPLGAVWLLMTLMQVSRVDPYKEFLLYAAVIYLMLKTPDWCGLLCALLICVLMPIISWQQGFAYGAMVPVFAAGNLCLILLYTMPGWNRYLRAIAGTAATAAVRIAGVMVMVLLRKEAGFFAALISAAQEQLVPVMGIACAAALALLQLRKSKN